MFLSIIRLLLRKRIKDVKDSYDRYLSIGDYISDRWGKARFLGFGEGTSIYDNVLVIGDVRVGKNCWIGPNCILDGSGGGLYIGDRCAISAGVHIYTHNARNMYTSGHSLPMEHGSVRIGNDCFIGPNSIIVMGSRLGNNCTVGALSFVNGISLQDGETCYGIPARIREQDLSNRQDSLSS